MGTVLDRFSRFLAPAISPRRQVSQSGDLDCGVYGALSSIPITITTWHRIDTRSMLKSSLMFIGDRRVKVLSASVIEKVV